jgi:hypothetical protein
MSRPLLLTVALTVLGFLVPGPAEARDKHPRVHHAIFEMREAYKELETTSQSFGGHRVRAMEGLQAAYQQTELALAAAGDPYVGFAPATGLYGGYSSHPHLRHALIEMREARKALERAIGGFGGHRAKAITDLDFAIIQVEQCIEYAR